MVVGLLVVGCQLLVVNRVFSRSSESEAPAPAVVNRAKAKGPGCWLAAALRRQLTTDNGQSRQESKSAQQSQKPRVAPEGFEIGVTAQSLDCAITQLK
jgi:hypothetical protein